MFSLSIYGDYQWIQVKFESQVTEHLNLLSFHAIIIWLKKSLSIMTVTGPGFCLFGTVLNHHVAKVWLWRIVVILAL